MKRWAGFSDCNSSEVWTKFMFARMERLPSPSAITAMALNSVRPVLNLSSATLACCVLSHVVGAMKYFGGHMAKIIEFYIPQSFRKVSKWFPPETGHPPLSLTTETFPYSLPLRWPPLRVNLPRRNSWARLAPIRSAVPIAKFPKTSPAPRVSCIWSISIFFPHSHRSIVVFMLRRSFRLRSD